MALHLLKMAVGVSDLDEMRKLQRQRRKERGKSCFFTRNMPRRSEELLAGGSIYWVVKGQVRVRQRLLGFTPVVGEEGERYCAVEYDRVLVPTLWQPRRPFQGWRYLLAKDAPPDRPEGMGGEENEMPPAMLRELRSLGLL
jgi:hypothetical protein